MALTKGSKKFLKGVVIFFVALGMILLYLAPVFSGLVSPTAQRQTVPVDDFVGPIGAPHVTGPTSAPPSLK